MSAATVIHEAGHAVVGQHLGLGVRNVSVVKEGDSLGRTFHNPAKGLYDLDTRVRVERLIVATWAGHEAAARATGHFNLEGAGGVENDDPEHGRLILAAEGGDLDHIHDLAEAVQGGPGRTTDVYIEYLRYRALDLLEDDPFIWRRRRNASASRS